MRNNTGKKLHTCKLGAAPVTFVDGDRSAKYPKRSEFVAEGVPFLNGESISDGRLDPTKANFISYDKFGEIKKGRLLPGDLILTTRGNGVGKTAFYTSPRPALINAQLLIIRPDQKKIVPGFLYYSFCNPDFQSQLSNFKSGSAQPQLPITALRDVEFSFPPLAIQAKIAAILLAYDDLIENNTRRIAILESMARAIYREWFVEFRFPGHENVKLVDSPLGMIPDGWKVCPLKEVYRTSSGGTPSRKVDEYFRDGTINWVKSKELDDRFIWDTEEKITDEGLSNSSAKLFPRNTIIMAMYGATIGQLGILGTAATTNQACCAFLTHESRLGHAYLLFNLLSNRTDIINLRAGAAQQNVSQDVIREIPFLVPTLEVVKKYNELIDPFLENIFRLQRKIVNLRHTRDLLLPKLISGELDVEDLDIETGETVTG